MRKLLFYFLILLCSQACAQEYVIDKKHWDVKDGLPHREVTCIRQDRQGFIWVSTPYGVSRFDGYKFVNYTESPNGPFSDVESFTEDMAGDIIIQDNEKTRYAKYLLNPLSGKITTLKLPIPDSEASVCIILGTTADSNLLLSFVRDNNVKHYYLWNKNGGISKYVVPGQYHVITEQLERNCVMVMNDSQELMQLDFHGNILKKEKVPFSKEVATIYFHNKYYYFRDNRNNICYQVSEDLEVRPMDAELFRTDYGRPEEIFNIDSAMLWVQENIFYPGTPIIHDFYKDNIPGFDRPVRSVFFDKGGQLWIGNDMGLNRISIRKNKFRQYYLDTGKAISTNTCRAVLPYRGDIFVVNEFSGLHRINLQTHHSSLYYLLGISKALARTENGFLTGAGFLQDSKGKPTLQPYGLPGNAEIWSFYKFDTGRYLLGAFPGLAWLNIKALSTGGFTQYNKFKELAQYAVLFIGRGQDGELWVCCNNGLYEYDTAEGIVARYSANDTGKYYLPATEFQHFSQDASGVFWLATTNGLIRWDKTKNTHERFTQANGLSSNNIYACYNDNYGNLWMSSDYGIMKMDKTSKTVKSYQEEDGITNNEFNRISHYMDDSGNIYFGSLCGLNVFDPKDFVRDNGNNDASPIVVTSFLQFNGATNKLEDKRESLVRTGQVALNPDDRFFTLEFALLNYDNPELTSYYWKIDGIDTGWNIQKDRTLRFSRLPYDLHMLQIKAQAANGSWSSNILTININVIRPFYLRSWFLIVAMLSLVAIAIAGYRWRVYLLRKENERLDRVVKEKTESLRLSLHQKEILLKEIHHRVKNNLQVISSLLHLQSNTVKDESAKNALLEGQNRVLSIALIHQKLYQDEKLDMVEFSNFADELFAQLKDVFWNGGVEIEFQNRIPETFLRIDIALPLGLILNELITNSCKYAFRNVASPCIKVKLEIVNRLYTLTYSDNGPGLPDEINLEHTKSLGLRLVNRLSKQLHGTATYFNNEWSNFQISFNDEHVE